jgi:hypothetical protein
MVWCCQPVAAAICSTVAPLGRLSRSIMSACLVPARGAGFSADAAMPGLALVLRFAGMAAGASAGLAPLSPGVAPSGASFSVSMPMACMPAQVIRKRRRVGDPVPHVPVGVRGLARLHL